jgi:hypothetical protein
MAAARSVEVGSRLMVMAHFEVGGVEVNGGSTTMTKSLRMRMTTTRSEARVEAAVCSKADDDVVACSVAGIEDGRWHGSGATVSRVTTERERARGLKFTKCDERKRGPKILVRGT